MSLFPLPFQFPSSSRYSVLGVSPEVTIEELRTAAKKYDAALKRSGASEDELAEAHAVSLEKAESRAKHDTRHPPLELMRLQPTWEPLFDDRGVAITVLRREIEAFLAAGGAEVFHPLDTTRQDFSGDYTHLPLLDDFTTNENNGAQ